jgi:hypothetical protein
LKPKWEFSEIECTGETEKGGEQEDDKCVVSSE